MSTVCAIILDYFGSDKTIACLSSLLDQGLDAVMIVDNSGDQKENTSFKNALKALIQNKPPFTVHQIINKQNLGFAKGVNEALRWLGKNHPHSYYLLINNDAQATPGMLRALLDFMHHNKKAALVSPVMDTGKNKIYYNWYHRFTGLQFSHRVFGAFPYLSGCCLLVDNRIIKDSLFDEDFFMYGEDVELCWRLWLSGREAACVRNAIVRHEGVGSSRQGDYFYEYHMARGHLLLSRKLASNQWEMLFLYCGKFLVMSARSVIRTIRYGSLTPIKAWINALRK